MQAIRRLLANKALLTIAVIAYSCVITALFFMPTSDIPDLSLPGLTDKVIHFFIHFFLVIVWQLFLFRRNDNHLSWKTGVLILAISLLYGIIVEILQPYLTISRTADLYDIVANFCGALVGVLLFQKAKRFLIP